MSTLVFVYGTLKQGHCNHRIMQMDDAAPSELVMRDATIKGDLYDLGPFPAAVESKSGKINGEVWDVSNQTVRHLDRLEGHPDFYKRKKVLILGTNWHAWAYFMPEAPKDAVPLPVGNWSDQRRN